MPNKDHIGGLPIPEELYEALRQMKTAIRFTGKYRITRAEIMREDRYEDSATPAFITEIVLDEGEPNAETQN